MPLTQCMRLRALCVLVAALCWSPLPTKAGSDPATVEEPLPRLVKANADWPSATLSPDMSPGADVTGSSIDGRTHVGGPAVEHEMMNQFDAVGELALPLPEVQLWQQDDGAWLHMELDYRRHLSTGPTQMRMTLPLHKTGVLQQPRDRGVQPLWYEPLQTGAVPKTVTTGGASAQNVSGTGERPDLSGAWTIEEDDKAYTATLDKAGNGTYTHKGGRIKTTGVANRLWQGTWEQAENDREGGFEVLLAEDGKSAKGIWWYSRVGTHINIPPKEHGGTYRWTRVLPIQTH